MRLWCYKSLLTNKSIFVKEMSWKKNNYSHSSRSKLKKVDPIADPKSPDFVSNFLSDWEMCRDRHNGQKEILHGFFVENAQYTLVKAGRKFAKTTVAIDIAWRWGHENPNEVIYLCYPTITQAIEILWEEKRLQWCDQKDEWMFEKYVAKTDDSKHILTFHNGTYIKLIGTWSEARGRGTQPGLLIVDEMQDCKGDYLDAMDPNLAAKDGRCYMSGTPPKKRNHWYDWQDRIDANPRGKRFVFSSYANDKLPHLKGWLDQKHKELLKANKEDEWLREYMAQDCFSHADRILPDPKFQELPSLSIQVEQFSYIDRIPFMSIATTPNYLCCIFGVLIKRKLLFVLESHIFPQIWDKSFKEMYPELVEKEKLVTEKCGQKIRRLVWDESKSFQDLIDGFTHCRKDIKWQERGIVLLRELMVMDKILFSDRVSDFGPECQNALIDESAKDVEKKYPFLCALAMTANEYFSMERISPPKYFPFDKYDALRDMGIPIPKKKKGKELFSFGW